MYKQYPSIYIDEGLDRIYRTWDPWVNRVTHTPPCTKRGGCLGLEGIAWPWSAEFWQQVGSSPLLSLGGDLFTGKWIGQLFGTGGTVGGGGTAAPKAMTPQQVQAVAYQDFVAGRITYEQYQNIVKVSQNAMSIAGQSSGMGQFLQILKWIGIIGGAGVGLYFLFPVLKEARSGLASGVKLLHAPKKAKPKLRTA